MLSYINTGHALTCPKHNGQTNLKCNCEARLYFLTGILAILASFLQITIGWHASMALASDALHAISDGMADIFAGAMIIYASKYPKKEHKVRRLVNQVIAIILALAALGLITEAGQRFLHGHHFAPIALVLGGLIGVVVDSARYKILSTSYKSEPNPTKMALMIHAKSDLWRSVIASFVGGILFVGSLVAKSSTYTTLASYADLIASFALSVYMLYMAYRLFANKPVCQHGHNHSKTNHDHHHEHNH